MTLLQPNINKCFYTNSDVIQAFPIDPRYTSLCFKHQFILDACDGDPDSKVPRINVD